MYTKCTLGNNILLKDTIGLRENLIAKKAKSFIFFLLFKLLSFYLLHNDCSFLFLHPSQALFYL